MYAYKIFGKCKIIYLLKSLSKILSVMYPLFSFCIDLLPPYSVKDPLHFFFRLSPHFFLKPVTPLSGTPHPFLLSTFCFCSNLYIYI